MAPQLQDLESSPVWKEFAQLNAIPRPSGYEDKVREYIESLATRYSREFKVDKAGNIIVYVPGSPGKENNPMVAIQNHMDMVCDRLPGVEIDFNSDPISTYIEDGWVKAKGTTLGADNGLGCSAAMCLIRDIQIEHPPLELLFTVDEETGLTGALNLEKGFVRANKMINLDSEEFGVFNVGCAGGYEVELTKASEFVSESLGNSTRTYELSLSGLNGGHSGVDIHLQRGNAIKMLSEILWEFSEENSFKIVDFEGGRAHNIIPRDAKAIIDISESSLNSLEKSCEKALHRWKSYLPNEDHKFEIDLEQLSEERNLGLSPIDSKELVSVLVQFPHGAHKFVLGQESSLVGLSSNLAKCIVRDNQIYILSSVRYFDNEEIVPLNQLIQSLARAYAYRCVSKGGYPNWRPNFDSELVHLSTQIFKESFDKNPQVTAIHAGLECGILKEKMGDVDIVSFGPTIENAHSPQERVNISSVDNFWILLKNLLKRL